MSGAPKIAAILAAGCVGYSRLAGADESGAHTRLRGLRNGLIGPAIDAHHGLMAKRTGRLFAQPLPGPEAASPANILPSRKPDPAPTPAPGQVEAPTRYRPLSGVR
jgi:hypothetical protein